MFPKGYRAREAAARARNQNRLASGEVRAQRAAALAEAEAVAAEFNDQFKAEHKAPVYTPEDRVKRQLATYAEPLPEGREPKITSFADVMQTVSEAGDAAEAELKAEADAEADEAKPAAKKAAKKG